MPFLGKVSLIRLCKVVVVVDCFCIALFSTLKQTHCTLVTCDSQCVTSFLEHALNIHPSSVVAALFGSYIAGAII